MKLGIISDTHNLLRPEVLAALSDVDAILHAGDINCQGVLDRLQEIAPTHAIRGNADKEWAERLPPFLDFEGRKAPPCAVVPSVRRDPSHCRSRYLSL